MGVAALVCGIVSVVCAFFGPGAALGIVLGIIAIVLGIMARKNPEQAKLATAGLVLGIIGTVLSGILFIACVVCIGALGAAGAGILSKPEIQDTLKNTAELKEVAGELKKVIESL
jgi:membrane-bound ClpP family serine protease